MNNLKEQLGKDIKVLVRPLKNDTDELVKILKRRLTKKEWKFYKFKLKNMANEVIAKELKCDNQRLDKIVKQTMLKLNQEKIKQELME